MDYFYDAITLMLYTLVFENCKDGLPIHQLAYTPFCENHHLYFPDDDKILASILYSLATENIEICKLIDRMLRKCFPKAAL